MGLGRAECFLQALKRLNTHETSRRTTQAQCRELGERDVGFEEQSHVTGGEKFVLRFCPKMDHADIKRAILDVSLKLGTELGEGGLTMRAIARGLGVSATALYQHYESKAAILRELRTKGMEQLNAYLAPAFDEPDPVQQLRRNAELYLRFSREHPWMYHLIYETAEDWGVDTEAKRAAAMASVERTFAALRLCDQRGLLLENVELEAAPLSIWAALHGMALLMSSGRVSPQHSRYPSEEPDVVIQRFVDYILRGILRV